MSFRVSGKNLDIGQSLREHAEKRVNETLKKHYEGAFTGHMTFEKEGHGFRAECTVHLSTGVTLQAHVIAGEAYAACDQAIERITKRLRRYKHRLKDRRGADDDALPAPEAAPYYVLSAPDEEAVDEAAPDSYNPMIIAEMSTTLKKLSVSDAVLDLDMTGAPVLVFRHASHGRPNIVYRRLDGNIGWIDPQAEGA